MALNTNLANTFDELYASYDTYPSWVMIKKTPSTQVKWVDRDAPSVPSDDITRNIYDLFYFVFVYALFEWVFFFSLIICGARSLRRKRGQGGSLEILFLPMEPRELMVLTRPKIKTKKRRMDGCFLKKKYNKTRKKQNKVIFLRWASNTRGGGGDEVKGVGTYSHLKTHRFFFFIGGNLGLKKCGSAVAFGPPLCSCNRGSQAKSDQFKKKNVLTHGKAISQEVELFGTRSRRTVDLYEKMHENVVLSQQTSRGTWEFDLRFLNCISGRQSGLSTRYCD